MNLTEAEASDKLCQESFNGGAAIKCQGNACMAWRWADGGFMTDSSSFNRDNRPYPDHPDFVFQARRGQTLGGIWRRPIPPAERRGFCGKAEPRLSEVEIST